MLSEPINHSPDLKKLWDEGHSMEIIQGFLVVRDVPFVNSKAEIKRGMLVTSLNLAAPDKTAKPDTHVIHFIGEYPCNRDGSSIKQIYHSTQDNDLIPGKLRVNHSFSNKPANGFQDYYEKITSYIRVISNPAKSLDDSVTEKTFQIIEASDDESVFNYLDTNSNRAEINKITEKLSGQRIAIIGLGGTGSYLLDLIAKTPVQEIHLFDGDDFLQHNAFRSPGATSKEKFSEHLKKVDYFHEIYSKMHRHVISHPVYVDEDNRKDLISMNFVFISMDTGEVKRKIISFLTENKISFIDVGIGIEDIEASLIGKVRVTTSSPAKSDHLGSRISFIENKDDDYDRNIQIADLNSLCATLAVIKWKKLLGFYKEHECEHHTTFSVYTNEITNDDFST